MGFFDTRPEEMDDLIGPWRGCVIVDGTRVPARMEIRSVDSGSLSRRGAYSGTAQGGDQFRGDILIGGDKTFYKDSQTSSADAGKIEFFVGDSGERGIRFIQGVLTVIAAKIIL